MNLAPTTDQLDLRESIRDVLSAQCPPSFVRQAMSDDQAWRGLWSTAVELGWTSLATRLVDDSGLGTFDLVLTLEACGEALAPLPMVSSVGLAAGALQAGGEAMANELQLIADGQVATLIAQPAAHRLPAAPMALRDGRVHVSVGEITDATRADTFVVLCATTDPARSYVATVPIGPGVTVTPTPSVDPSRPMARLEIDAEPRAVESVDTSEALAPAMAALAAELVGVAAAVLTLAVEHARARTQFGRPIGSYQGVKHALADRYVAVERARSLTYAAAAALDDDRLSARQRFGAAALAKAAAGDAATEAARTAVQVFGALGQTWEHDTHLFLRRAWLGAALLGDSSALYHLEGQRFLRELN